MGRVLRLTLLAPDLVEAIQAGRQPARVALVGLMEGMKMKSGKRSYIPTGELLDDRA